MNITITRTIKSILSLRGKNIRWLAKQLGVSESTMSRTLSDNNAATMDTLARIAKVLGMKLSDLISEWEKKNEVV